MHIHLETVRFHFLVRVLACYFAVHHNMLAILTADVYQLSLSLFVEYYACVR